MDKMIIENMRCFRSRQEVPLAPLTLLVGENSTGKSTFLAALRIAWDLLSGESEPNFNEDPFNLGAYDNIANYRRGRGGRAKSFLLGIETARDEETVPIRLTATFVPERGQPAISMIEVKSQQHGILISRGKEKRHMELVLTSGDKKVPLSPSERFGPPFPFDLRYAFHLMRREMVVHGKETEHFSGEEYRSFEKMLRTAFQWSRLRPYAIAPIRTKPERTYDPKKETQRPEGAHIPMVLARTMVASGERSSQLVKALSNFGQTCGLFDDVKVRRLGTKASDPFQIEVKVSGPAFNLVDVGYGVSQALPILVDSLTGERGQTFLMQQPEVHLHPRAQAALGTFLLQLVKQDGKKFVVETHSDYLIERIRMDIRDEVGKVKPDDVVILYFERDGAEVNIHPISIDGHGNVLDAPSGYRQFFLEEERRFFGV